jgi:hypothetical protein
VTGFAANGGVLLQFAGDGAPSQKGYVYLKPYSPTVGDRVMVVHSAGTYVVIGGINE